VFNQGGGINKWSKSSNFFKVLLSVAILFPRDE